LGTLHAVATVLDLLDRAGNGVVERRPPAVAVELGVTGIELGATGAARVHARGLRVDVLAGPGGLGAGLAQNPELRRAEPHAPLVLGGGQGGLVGCHAANGTSIAPDVRHTPRCRPLSHS